MTSENPNNNLDTPDSTHSKHSTNSTHSTHSKLNILTTAFFYLSILLFIIGFNFSDVMVGNWYQQFFPNLHGAVIKDIVFTDSLTGYAVTGVDSFNTAYILKTTTGGDTWFNSLTDNTGFTKVQFINNNTGFVGRLADPPNYNRIFKTINGGANWFTLNTPTDVSPIGIDVLNEDSIWIADDIPLVGGIYRTTNGGSSWTRQYGSIGGNPKTIFMYNGRIGFMYSDINASLNKTTNSGENWFPVSGGGFSDIYFIDSLNGWKANGNMKKTIDGGLNWITQILPNGGNFITNGMAGFSVINKDTVWGSGGIITNGGTHRRGILYRTTNGGINWLFQIVDTSFGIGQFYDIQFLNKNTGWGFGMKANTTTVYWNIHTTNGGDTTFILGIRQLSNEVPKEYKLYQNYPNPFNPRTVIPFSLKKSAYVRLIAYDITGREIDKMVDGKYSAGEYEVDFMGKFTASGVYFYRMEVIDEASKQVFSETKKMILLK